MSVLTLVQEVNDKLEQIEKAINALQSKKRQKKIDETIKIKVDEVLSERLANQSLDDFKSQNKELVSSLEKKIRSTYNKTIDDKIKILEKAKNRLLILK